jgi:rsbT co-antagonist protein RsbR
MNSNQENYFMTQLEQLPDHVQQELMALRQQVADLEQQLAHARSAPQNQQPPVPPDIAEISDERSASDHIPHSAQQLIHELRASEARFRTLVDMMTAAVMIHQGGKFRFANPAAEILLGYTREEIFHLQFQDFIPPDYLVLVQQRAAARQRGEEVPHRYEIKIVRKDGEERWIEINNNLVEFEGQMSVIVIGIDITEFKRTEEKLRASETRFRTLSETMSVGIFIIQGTRCVYVNPAVEYFTGYTSQEVLDLENFWDVIHPDFHELAQQRSAARQRGEEVPSRYEIQLISKHGAAIWVDITARMIDFDGVSSILVTLFDITERKHAEEERKALEAQIIEAQRATLRELSTPLIPLANHVLALPLIGSVDTERAQHIMENLLQGVADHQAHSVILDLTGLNVMDSHVADTLIRSAQAVRLLGTQVILTGITPPMAQTLVHLHADLGDIVTFSTLQQGVEYAIR